MELRHLEYFLAVADELSFTRAARRLHVVQSGVSSVVAALERELGAPLFDRDRHAVALTEAGRALLPEARATLAAAQAAAGAGTAFRGLVATVISITPAAGRGEGLAGLFLGAYIGMAIPVVGLGVATLWVSLQVSVLGLAVVLAAVITGVTRRLLG